MESRTKFNLKESLEIWKSELSQNSNMTRDNINELESHLQDEIHELQKIGLSIEESMLIAQNRIGNLKELTTEFGKVNKGVYFRNKIIPYLKGILLFIGFITIAELLTNCSILIAKGIGINDGNLNFVSIGILMLSIFILLLFSYKKYNNINLYTRKLTKIPILVSVIIVGKLLTLLSLPILTRSIELSDFGVLRMNLNIYKLILGLFILTISCIVFYSSKKENKIKISG